METETLSNLKIVDEDDGSVVCTRGVVDTNGGDAVVYETKIFYDANGNETGRKLEQRDRLSEATIKRNRNTSHLTGVSQHLIRKMGVAPESAVVNYKLHHGQGERTVGPAV